MRIFGDKAHCASVATLDAACAWDVAVAQSEISINQFKQRPALLSCII